MVAPLIAGAKVARKISATKKTKGMKGGQKPTRLRQQSKNPIVNSPRTIQQYNQPTGAANLNTHPTKNKATVIKETLTIIVDASKALMYTALPMVMQFVFYALALDAFSLEDKWYGFAIPAYTAGVMLFILSLLSSIVSIGIAGFFLRKYLKDSNILITFILSLSGSVALSIIPWAGLWIIYTTLSVLFKK